MAHRLAPEAVTDLSDVWYYLAKEGGNIEMADRMIASVTSRFFLLSGYPHLGRARDDLRQGLRSYPVGEYLIIYRIQDEDVVILRVLHSRRDIETLSF